MKSRTNIKFIAISIIACLFDCNTSLALSIPKISVPRNSIIDHTFENISYKRYKGMNKKDRVSADPIYNQNVGYDPAGWLLSGPALDTAATALQRPYYESYGVRNYERNYIYYDWGW